MTESPGFHLTAQFPSTGQTITGATARLWGCPVGGGAVPVAVPEPGSLLLVAVGFAGVVLTHRYGSARRIRTA